MKEITTVYEQIAILGTRVKNYRKKTGMTQKRLSEITGLSIFTISQFENGKGQGMSLTNFCSILKALNLEDGMETIVPDIMDIDLGKEWNRQNKRK